MTSIAERIAREPRVALVIEGGGMRAVYSMGALHALQDAGLTTSFAIVVGSSAGAMNGAYFAAGQADRARHVYAGYLAQGPFVRLLRRGPVVDIDFLVDDVLRDRVPLDLARLRRSRAVVEAVVTNVRTGAAVYRSLQRGDPYEVLRASVALPVLYNRSVVLDGEAFVDGGVAEPVPCARAVSLGASAVLGVFTRERGRRPARGAVAQAMLRAALCRQPRAVRNGILGDRTRHASSVDLLEDEARVEPCWALWPSRPADLVTTCARRADSIERCGEMGYRDMERLLTSPA